LTRSTAALALVAAFAAGCGGSDPSTEPARPTRSSLPATDRDPLPYTPPPTEDARAGDTVALAAAGGEDQARRMLPALVRALRDPDDSGDRALAELFADRVGRVNERHARRPGVPRGLLVPRLRLHSRRSILAPDAEVDDLFDVRSIEVVRASRYFRRAPMPSTARVTDLVVVAPLLPAAAGPLRTLLGWRERGTLVIRPGREPRIVAF